MWPRLHETLLAKLRGADALDLSRAAVDGPHIRALKCGRPRRRPDVVLGDRGYDHDKYRSSPSIALGYYAHFMPETGNWAGLRSTVCSGSGPSARTPQIPPRGDRRDSPGCPALTPIRGFVGGQAV